MTNVESKDPQVIPDPFLLELFKRIALINPNLKFAYEFIGTNSRPYTSLRSCDKSRCTAPENFMFGQYYDVYDSGKPCGVVRVDYMYQRDKGNVPMYGIKSHLVDRTGRGSRGFIRTSDIAKAVANAKKYLRAPTDGFALYNKFVEADMARRDAMGDLMRPINRGNFLTSTRSAQILLNAYMTGRPVDPVLDSEMRDTLVTDKFDSALSEYYLAKWLESLGVKGRLFIHRHSTSYSFFVDEPPDSEASAVSAQVMTMEFEDLPVAVQERLAVLQLMEDREVVLDVGIRITDTEFFIKV
jgi:hypothetical protein